MGACEMIFSRYEIRKSQNLINVVAGFLSFFTFFTLHNQLLCSNDVSLIFLFQPDLAGWNFSITPLIFTLDFIYQRHHHRLELQNLCSLQPPYLQRYADAEAGKGPHLYNCFDFVGGTIARICIPVLNERVVYNHDKRVHGVKFQTVVLPNGLIINLEGQWEDRRQDCVLCFMNWVY